MNRDLMEKAGFSEEMKLVENRQCPFCQQKININDFKDELSLKEFTISGLCQKCQDKFFGKPERIFQERVLQSNRDDIQIIVGEFNTIIIDWQKNKFMILKNVEKS